MARGLTARTVETFQPGSIRQEIPDGYLKNLYHIIQPGGARSWAVRYRSNGQSRKFTIGPYPTIDLKTARELGAKALRAVAEGRDPSREKVLARQNRPDTVGGVVALFLDLHCKKRNNRASTVRLYTRRFNHHVLPQWKDRPIGSIVRADVRALTDSIMAAGTPREANAVLSLLKMLFSWALERDIVAASPCVAIKPPAVLKSRERVLLDSELADIWHACDQLNNPQYRTKVRLLMLTGQRHSEVAHMTWSELDLPAKLWRLPAERCKNGHAHEVPLSAPVLEILAGMPHWGDFVLTQNGKRSLSVSAHCKVILDAVLPSTMPLWHLHDLRRTMITGMAKLGTQLPVVERCVNHIGGSFGGVAGVYQKFGYEDAKREAFENWARHVMTLVA